MDIAPIVAPFVVIAIIFGVLALIFALSLCYVYEPPTPVTIRFSNEDKPGSLAKMLKVFKVECNAGHKLILQFLDVYRTTMSILFALIPTGKRVILKEPSIYIPDGKKTFYI